MSTITRRNFGALAGSIAASTLLPARLAAERTKVATPASAAVDPLALVDPELIPGARQILALRFPTSDEALRAMRAQSNNFDQTPLPGVSVAERKISGATGSPDITVYVFNARPGASQPGILYTHGGGYIAGSTKSAFHMLQEAASDLDCVIVSVDYRRAPEVRYSGSIEENYAGLKWMYGHARELGVDPRRIALMGGSAGGGHAALLAIKARDRGEVPIIFQCLIYPMLDDRTGSTRDVAPYIGHIAWTREANRYGWRSFLGQEPGGSNVPAGAVPARVRNMAGLPPTFIGVGTLDLFINEDIEYATRLIEAAVPTELLVVPGAYHGFEGIASEASVSKRFVQARNEALRRAFAKVA